MGRPILIIDADLEFVEFVRDQVAPYGFDLVVREPYGDALAGLTAVNPALLIVAVEEPDKLGYALCNKAKKLWSELPVMLVTRTVAATDFEQHRALVVHAEEYVDKRDVSGVELLGKIDNLIGLGELEEIEALDDIALEIDESEMTANADLAAESVEPTAPAAPARPSQDLGNILGEFDSDEAFDALLGPAPGSEPSAADEFNELRPQRAVAPPATPNDAPAHGENRPRPSSVLPLPRLPSEPRLREPSQPSFRAPSEPRLRAPSEPLPPTRTRAASEVPAPLRALTPSRPPRRSDVSSAPPLADEPSSRPTEIGMRSSHDLTPPAAPLSSELAELQNHVRQLQHAKASLEKKNSELEERLLDATVDSTAKKDAETIARQQAELQRLAQELTSIKQTATAHEAQLADEQADYQQSLDAALRARDEMASAAAEMRAELERQLVGLRRELEDARGGSEARSQELTATVAQERLRREQAEAAVAELTAQVETLSRRAAESSTLLQEGQAAQAELTRLQGELQVNANQAQAAAAQVAGLTDELTTLRGQLTEAESQFTRANERLRSERTAVETQVASLTVELETVKQRAAQDLESARANSVAELEAYRTQTAQELHQARATLNHDMAAARQRADAATLRIGELEALLAGHAQTATQVTTLEGRLAELTQAHARAEAALGDTQRELAAQKKLASAIETDNATFQAQVLRANQRSKADEELLGKARKALAVALTVLDENRRPGT